MFRNAYKATFIAFSTYQNKIVIEPEIKSISQKQSFKLFT